MAKLNPLDEVRLDAEYNYMKRLNQQKADEAYEESKRQMLEQNEADEAATAPTPSPRTQSAKTNEEGGK